MTAVIAIITIGWLLITVTGNHFKSE